MTAVDHGKEEGGPLEGVPSVGSAAITLLTLLAIVALIAPALS